ncbi:hypothetical protein [Streptomyces sp. NL15-2K]|nr:MULTISPECIES: hypothetical protein [Actinomycetes]WKX15377.1 hypothetical protein Q4V64_50960 [Kutzneria buriramensis]
MLLDNLTRHSEGRPLRNVVDKRRGYVVDEPHSGWAWCCGHRG